MAKQVKVFDLDIGGTATTVYTVPAGRVAKVEITKYTTKNNAVNSATAVITGGEFTVGSTPMPKGVLLGSSASSQYQLGGSFFSFTGALNANATAYVYTASYVASSVSRIHYLPSGATITMRDATAQFCVIEEF